ncbi:MAG: hypothetical protein FWE91_08800 [Defluviitaleaceae bacterium]|nr:hypothetical protein [Defluviitaleaceae bacterium]MCL2836030.1 hypothetical protein [Defluviitaleaceae bacterium]
MQEWDKFIEQIRNIAVKLDEDVFSMYGGCVICTLDNIEQIKATFIESHALMMREMDEETENLEHHKLISSSVKSILKYPIFTVAADAADEMLKKDPLPIKARYPNEYFAYIAIWSLMADFGAAFKNRLWNIESYTFKFPDYLYYTKKDGDDYYAHSFQYAEVMIKLLHHLGKDVDNFPLFTFNHTLQTLEMLNDCVFHGFANKYFGE